MTKAASGPGRLVRERTSAFARLWGGVTQQNFGGTLSDDHVSRR
ncbi:MAG: hypothetical protein ACJ74T_09835 [Pyrinomonadaceae bacterium]